MAQLLAVKKYPDPILRIRAKDIPVVDIKKTELRQLIERMAKTMQKENGIGLAAPQIGKSIRLTVIDTKDGVLPLINPKITKRSWKKELGEEGCLSIPGVFGLVKRHQTIKVSSVTIEGKTNNFSASGLFARVIQHEIDHLDGVLFIDKTTKLVQGKELLKAYESR